MHCALDFSYLPLLEWLRSGEKHREWPCLFKGYYLPSINKDICPADTINTTVDATKKAAEDAKAQAAKAAEDAKEKARLAAKAAEDEAKRVASKSCLYGNVNR